VKRQIQISVTSPCHEQWSSFRTTSKGGFCASCQKEVTDFSTWDDDRLKAYLKTERKNVCGRFKEDQLKIYSYDQHRPLSLKWFAFLVTTLLLIFSKPALAQRQKTRPPMEKACFDRIEEASIPDLSVMRISGVVEDESGERMPGVNVVRKGTVQGVVTDANGKFFFEVAKPAAGEILVFTFVGYTQTEICIRAKERQSISVSLFPDVTVLGGFEYHTISPRRWWWSFKNLFRKNVS
jgi:hypothetical protein